MIEGFPDKAIVILNLVNPKEKLWGGLLGASQVGITLRGMNLDSFEDWVRQIATESDEPTLNVATMFVPMSRVERIFLDEEVGTVQSHSEYFEERVGKPPAEYLGLTE